MRKTLPLCVAAKSLVESHLAATTEALTASEEWPYVRPYKPFQLRDEQQMDTIQAGLRVHDARPPHAGSPSECSSILHVRLTRHLSSHMAATEGG